MSVPIGSGLSDSQWVYPFSQLQTKDLLARVIYAEDTKTTSGQAAVAQVLRNRYDNPDGYNFGHGGVNTWAMVVYKACSVAQGPNENAQRLNTNDSFWANALSLATKLVQNQSISSTVGARYFWKSADAWPSYNADSTKVKVNVKSYLNSSGKGNYFHNNSETFILAIDYGNDADTKFAFMKIAQFRLNDLGYNCGTPDGKQGNVTDAKIKQFQTAKGYTADGIIGSTTWNALLPQVKKGNVNDAVRFLRARLTAKGYSGLGTSTTFDSTLESKVKQFQTSAGLTSDGIVGMNTWRKLG